MLKMELKIPPKMLKQLVARRIRGVKLNGQLISARKEDATRPPKGAIKLASFRRALLQRLVTEWTRESGRASATEAAFGFATLSRIVAKHGALVLGDSLREESFGGLVAAYDNLMQSHASPGLLHQYLDLSEHPEFILNQRYTEGFLHPLMVALIAYRMGGPVHVVDARCKDASCADTRIRDGMLHVDHTPFEEEFKIIFAWQKTRSSDAKGQSFVYLPGTHLGVRPIWRSTDHRECSFEDNSVFTDEESVQRLFDFQRLQYGSDTPVVVEVQSRDRPMTILFSAGSLVHHRYGSKAGSVRSSITVAFRLWSESTDCFFGSTKPTLLSDLDRYLFGVPFGNTSEEFIRTLAEASGAINSKISEVMGGLGGTTLIPQESMTMTKTRMDEWYASVTCAPDIEELKRLSSRCVFGSHIGDEQLVTALAREMMAFDRHGALNLILYADSHEEIRKWARKRLREMKAETTELRLRKWSPEVHQPSVKDILLPRVLIQNANRIIRLTQHYVINQSEASLDDETGGFVFGIRSVHQLSEDLAEALNRCHSIQCFLSTSLFLFLCVDELRGMCFAEYADLTAVGGRLLRHYISTAILAHQLNTRRNTCSNKASQRANSFVQEDISAVRTTEFSLPVSS